MALFRKILLGPIGVFTAYLILAAILTWPALRGDQHLLIGGYGDPPLTLWVLGWDWHHIDTADISTYWDGNFYYPRHDTMGLQENYIAQAVLGWPVYWLTRDILRAYNILLVLSFAAAGLAAWLLMRALTERPVEPQPSSSAAAAWVAGLIFAFNPFRFSHMGHLNLLTTMWLPLCLLAAHRLRNGENKLRPAIAMTACTVLCFLSSGTHGVFLLFFLTCFWIWNVRATPLRATAWAITAVCLAGLILYPFYLPYLRAQQGGPVRTVEFVEHLSPAPTAFLRAPAASWLYGQLLRPSDGFASREDEMFPGFVPVVLALASWLLLRPRRGHPVRFYSFMAVGAGLLALGPYLHVGKWQIPLPYLAFYHVVPGAAAMRWPERAFFTATLGIAVLAGFGVQALLARYSLRMAPMGIALSLLILAETAQMPLTGVDFPSTENIPPVYRWLASAPDGPVLELPMARGGLDGDSVYMYFSTLHWKPLVNGYAAYIPPEYFDWMKLTHDIPTPELVAALRLTGVRYVVIHLGDYSADVRAAILYNLDALGAFRPVASFDLDRVFELRPSSGN